MNYTSAKDFCVSDPLGIFFLDVSYPLLDFSSLILAPRPYLHITFSHPKESRRPTSATM